MSLTVTDIAAAFSHHEFQDTYEYMLDDIEWMLVGERNIRGKVNVVATCEESSKYLATVRTRFITFKIIEAERSVVIDSRAEYVDAEGESSFTRHATSTNSMMATWPPSPRIPWN